MATSNSKKKKSKKSGGFQSMGLIPTVFRGVMNKGYKVPTKIQREAIPQILAGFDVVAMAPTGSGKTAAFIVPMLQRLRQHLPGAGVRALVLSPTRDLAIQTLKFVKQLGKFTDLRTSLLVGGDKMEDQFEELAHNPDIIIATPGRLMHHLVEVDGMSLHTVEYIVFDEADTLFGMGFAQQLHIILSQLSENRQTLLFSATLPRALAEFAKSGLHDYKHIMLDQKISPDLSLVFLTVRPEEKVAALLYLVREKIGLDEQTLIFVSTNYRIQFLNILFREEGIESSISYSTMDACARKNNLSKFKARKTMLLIASDNVERGIDIPSLDNVVHFDFPYSPKKFVHKMGRVARAGRKGTAYSFVTPADMPYLLDFHMFFSKPLRPAPTEEEVLHDMEGVYSRIDQALANGETIYGRFPQKFIDLVSDRVREVISGCADLMALQKPCANGFRLHTKIKSKPSRESIRRTKDLPREGVHPMFKTLQGSNELTALAFFERLKAFRPKQTILEAEGEAVKSKHSQGSNQRLDVMRKKRLVHDEVIDLIVQKRSIDQSKGGNKGSTPSKVWEEKEICGLKRKSQSYKDEEYYISSIPKNQHYEAGLSVKGNDGFQSSSLDAAVLDLVADDISGLQKQKSSYHWDKRSKKYIKLNNGEHVAATGKIKTESGRKVKASKTGIYKKWKERSHRQISLNGQATEDISEGGTVHTGSSRIYGNKWQFKGGKGRRSVPNANVPFEIRDPEQVRKDRQQKASRTARMKSKPPKGSKFSKKGKRMRK